MLLAALWILGILLALILLLLFLRVGVHIAFGGALKVDACVGPVRIAVVPKKKQNPRKRRKRRPRLRRKSRRKRKKRA